MGVVAEFIYNTLGSLKVTIVSNFDVQHIFASITFSILKVSASPMCHNSANCSHHHAVHKKYNGCYKSIFN